MRSVGTRVNYCDCGSGMPVVANGWCASCIFGARVPAQADDELGPDLPDPPACEDCDGKGTWEVALFSSVVEEKCDTCGGSGY